MRVFQLIKGLGRGGAETLLVAGHRHLARDRITAGYGFLLPHKDALVPDLRSMGADVVCFPMRGLARELRCVFEIARFLRSWGADVLHCHLPIAGIVGRLAGTLAGVPVVYTEHNVMESYHPWTRRANRWTWGMQSRVLAVSAEVAASIRKNAGDRVPVSVVRNGVDVGRFQPAPDSGAELKRRLGIPEKAPVVGTVAVFRPHKRLDCWLNAARLVQLQRPEARFLMVGDGALRPAMERLAKELGLEGKVLFAGAQADVRPYLAAMDLFLSSSSHEGLPVALLEAMAMERPVVATRVGGVPEIVLPGATGRLVDPGQPPLLAKAVLDLLAMEEELGDLGRRCRDLVVADFSVQRMAQDLAAAYALAAEGRRHG